ncbi:Os03g0340300 [Oryza sativa Japonica Group]|uniref:Os03g0340300 protein n=2 Tax=Oryza sativa subsp. japonica TaxID=39947 RepID=Q0DS11_ORYSJ|nr:hypothetical protein EE612_017309 [Oryza sativa]KAF2939163.1 hypothetical protein DAI22_03g172250 [Oryza sativa Japonica Group]BAF11977.1 Os03g0340300 [Oryza sativa Japonica Group]BAS84117.1 Os03g0340300 [Oryza sativa Japonica Group]|eukprot:NP_001050063.1 Os03g0340300 [Oryza sativa Japonica Group]
MHHNIRDTHHRHRHRVALVPRRRRRAARLAGDDGGAAERARRVRPEPPVDALDVEPVAAPWQEAAPLPVPHLPQAHRALHRRRRLAAGDVHEHRQRRDVQLPERRLAAAGAGAGGDGGHRQHVLRARGHGEPVEALEAHGEHGHDADRRRRRVRAEPEVAAQGHLRRVHFGARARQVYVRSINGDDAS